MKNPMTPAGIEPATFRFVAQLLNPVLPRSTWLKLVYVILIFTFVDRTGRMKVFGVT